MRRLTLGLLPLLVLVLLAGRKVTAETATAEVIAKWQLTLPAGACRSSSLGSNCHSSSPAVADVDGDGRVDIIVATNNGHVLAVAGDGKVLWDTDTAPLFGLPAGQQGIASSPAVADLEGDGSPEVIVGTGLLGSVCNPGGIIVLDSRGRLKSGWPRQTFEQGIPPSNCPDPIFASPAVGDLDNDGDLEIVAGSFDHRLYAWHHDGRLVNGYPAASHLQEAMGWNILKYQFADSIWSSPALADLDGDGYLDIITGTDEGALDGDDFKCTYRLPPNKQNPFCGGTLYALDRRGNSLPGYPRHVQDVIQSSPAVADVDGDGRPEVFAGGGDYYYENSPDHPTGGFRLFAWDHRGQEPPGWQGGKVTNKGLPASPAIGDIAGDDRPEILIPGMDGKLYAWHDDGQTVAGFPMTPRNLFGKSVNHDVGKSLTLADYDGDGKMEAFLTVGWSVVIVDGNGRMLTNTNFPDDKSTPYYYTDGPLLNNVVVGDIDGDGRLELVAQNSQLVVWDLPSGAQAADWPMFRQNAARTGSVIDSRLTVNPSELVFVGVAGAGKQESTAVLINAPGAGFSWQASAGSSHFISLPEQSGVAYNGVELLVGVDVPSSLAAGDHDLGKVEISVVSQGQDIADPRQSIPVHLTLIRQVGISNLPVVSR